jgi:hypothetical protein
MAFAAAALPFMAIAGTAIQGVSSFAQSRYQGQVAKNNAKIAEANAGRASYASQIEQMRSDREYLAAGSTLRASQAASGLDVLGSSQRMARANLDRVRGEAATDIRMQGLYDVGNLMQEQANFLGESRALRTQGWMGLAATAFDIGSQVNKLPSKKKPPSSSLVSSSSSSGSSKSGSWTGPRY